MRPDESPLALPEPRETVEAALPGSALRFAIGSAHTISVHVSDHVPIALFVTDELEALSPDQAEALGRALIAAAAEARRRGWEPSWIGGGPPPGHVPPAGGVAS